MKTITKLGLAVILFMATATTNHAQAQTKEETISWLKEKLSKYMYMDKASNITLQSIDECKMVFNYTHDGTKQYQQILPTEITGINNDDRFMYSAQVASDQEQGKEATFKVVVHEIKTKQLPALDDEFAKDVDEEVESLDELKAKIRKELEESKNAAADEAVQDLALRQAVDNAEIVELPHVMVHDEVHRQMDLFLNDMQRQGISPELYYQITGTTEHDLHVQMEADADVRTKTSLVLEQIIKDENIVVSEEEIAAEIEELAKQYNMDADRVRGLVSSDMLTNDIQMKKAMSIITDSAIEE